MYDLSSGRSVYQLQLDSRKKQKQGGSCLFFSRFPFIIYVKFQERHRQTPDVNKGGQFICDKQIVGAEELRADRVPREVFPLVALIYSRVNRADWEDGISFFPRN